MNRTSAIFLGLLLSIFLFSCESSSGVSVAPDIATLSWVDDGNGFIQYKTNDVAYCGKYYKSSQTFDLSTEEVVGKKISGAQGYGYGVIFMYSDSNNYYRLQVLPIGKYAVVEYLNGVLSTLVNWTDSTSINQGLNVSNTIRIDKSGNTYTIFINNNSVVSYDASDLTSGNSYFCVSI
jgi:hypothetical protein